MKNLIRVLEILELTGIRSLTESWSQVDPVVIRDLSSGDLSRFLS